MQPANLVVLLLPPCFVFMTGFSAAGEEPMGSVGEGRSPQATPPGGRRSSAVRAPTGRCRCPETRAPAGR